MALEGNVIFWFQNLILDNVQRNAGTKVSLAKIPNLEHKIKLNAPTGPKYLNFQKIKEG